MKQLNFNYELSRTSYFFLGSLSFIILLIGWHFLVDFGLVKEYFLPSPKTVYSGLINLFLEDNFLIDIKASFYRVSIGYMLAVIFAIPIGMLIGSFKFFEALIEPLNNFIRYTPLPAFIPLIILWVGIGDLNQITIIFLGVFWSLIVLVADAVSNVPRQLIEIAQTLGTNRRKILISVIFPSALPGIYDSLRVAIGWAWSSLILAEIVGANTGIGHMIMESQRFLRTSNVIAGIILVGVIGLLFDYLFKILYKPLFPWTEKN